MSAKRRTISVDPETELLIQEAGPGINLSKAACRGIRRHLRARSRLSMGASREELVAENRRLRLLVAELGGTP